MSLLPSLEVGLVPYIVNPFDTKSLSTQTHTHTYTHTHTHKRTHTRTHTHIHTHIHAHAHTHTHSLDIKGMYVHTAPCFSYIELYHVKVYCKQ
jgi:hypothetical protein